MTLNPQYYDDKGSSAEIVREMEKRYQKDIYLQQQFWIQADIDTRFKAGDQSLWSEIYGTVSSYSERQFNFNRIRRIVNLIVGHQRRNRKSLTIVPQENNDEYTSDQLSGVLQWGMSNCDGYHTISSAFESAVTTGFSLLCPWIDYREDPISGDIKIDKLDFNAFMIDPNFKQTDLSDAEYVWTRRFVKKNQAKVVFPGRDSEIDAMHFSQRKDNKFQFMQQNLNFNQSDIAPLDWYWYKDSRKALFLHDEETGECVEWTGDDESFNDFVEMHPYINVIRTHKPTTKLAVVLNGQLMYDGPNPYDIDDFPFVGVFGYFEPNIPYYWWKIQGVVRGLRDSQYLFNRKKRIELDILESQISSGLMVKEDALVDIKDAFMEGQGRVLVLKKTAAMEDVQPITPPGIDESMTRMTESLAQEMLEISGVNEELMGSADDDKAGILAQLRQGAGLTTLQTLFDQLDLSCKNLGGLLVKMIQSNFSPGKIKRILGEEASPRFADKAFGKYDLHTEEGIMTTTQRQMQLAQLLHLKEMGMEIPDQTIINAASIQNKQDLINDMEKESKQAQEMQQAQEKQQLQSQQVLSETLLAKAASDKALASERMNKIHLDKALNVERLANAQAERDAGTLDRIKAAKELTEIDLNHLLKTVEIIKSLQEAQSEESYENAEEAVKSSEGQEIQTQMQPAQVGDNVQSEGEFEGPSEGTEAFGEGGALVQ